MTNPMIDVHEQMAAIEAKVTLDGQGDQYSIAVARKPAWHQKGYVKLDGELTVAEGIREAHLDWHVSKSPMTTAVVTKNGVSQVEVPGQYALTTTHAYTGAPIVLGVVGEQRETVQIPELLTWATELVGGYGPDAAQISSVGSYMNQRKVFASLKFAEGIKVGGKDPIEMFLGIKENMDGRGAIQWTVSNVRSECRNTVNLSIRQAQSKGTIRHTTNVRDRMAQVAKIIELTDEYTTGLVEVYDRMLDVTVDDAMFADMIAHAFEQDIPNPITDNKVSVTAWNNKVNAITAERFGEFNTFERGTGYGAFNAITSYLNYGSASAEGDAAELAHKQDQRAIAVMEGKTDDVTKRAMAFVLARV